MTSAASLPVIVLLVASRAEAWCARLLLQSIRAFGGPMREAPVLVYYPQDLAAPDLQVEGVTPLPLALDEAAGYPFAAKAWACAEAEARIARGARSLVWFDVACLVANPPLELALDAAHDAALRPVHLRNVGSPCAEPPDGYWQEVYRRVGLVGEPPAVESYVDGQRIRAYYNCCTFALNPALGLCRRWRRHLAELIADQAFQASYCRDDPHSIFLHQAVWSALLARDLPQARIRLLPPTYGYPLHLHHELAPERRAGALNDLVSIIYGDIYDDWQGMNGIAIREPLRSWLRREAEAWPQPV